MTDGTKDQIQGAIHAVKGAVKEKVGTLTHNADLEDAGTAEKIGGKVQQKVGDIEKVLEK